jgi:hypothetical protein
LEKPPPLAPQQQRALDRLKQVPGIDAFYLAGGTAIALRLGHRQSVDLDLFSLTSGIDLDVLRAAVIRAIPDAEVLALSDATLRLRVEGIPVDFVRYPYPPLEQPTLGVVPLPLATLLDLAVMKLAAISRRGIRRDFWDLYAMTISEISLREAGRSYVARFGIAEADLYHVLRALTYFADAEAEKVFPAGLSAERWDAIKEYFRQQAPKLVFDP